MGVPLLLLATAARAYFLPDAGARVRECIDLAILRGIEDLPDSLLPPGCDDLLIVPEEGYREDAVLHLVGAGADTTDFGTFEYGGMYNPAKTEWRWLPADGIVQVYSQMPFSAFTYWAEYRLGTEPPALVPLGEGTMDPSQDAVDAAWRLIDSGMVAQAVDTLSMIFYPQYYYESEEMGAALLRRSHELALQSCRDGDVMAACSVMTLPFEHDYLFNLDYGWITGIDSGEDYRAGAYAGHMPFEEAILIANDYGFLLLEAGHPSEAVPVLSHVVMLDPSRAVAYLNLADALWALGRFGEARPLYGTYLSLLDDDLLELAPGYAVERSE
ncbi:MAG: hypothetical protein QUS11_06860 [Candidatus Fermentibacter sp.]|nr:hypothetical protein [Candidatus Fermentibacter sp.]